jgi:uncharacterized Zn finger protein
MADQPEPRPDRPEGRQGGEGQHASRKPKVRIGPRHRRQESAPQQPGPRPDRQAHPPRQGEPRNGEAGGGKRKRRRRKGNRRPDVDPNAQAPRPIEGAIEYAPGMSVLPPVQADLDETPSGVFPVARLDASGEVEMDEMPDDGSDSDLDDSSSSETAEPEAAAPTAPSNGRERRKRRKRRDRPEPPPVDKTKGFWWAEQWMRSFEMLYPSNASRSRLAKGKTYARRGQVVELEVGPNGILARVQGSRPRPYQVRLELNRLRRETWGRILHHVAGKAAFLAQLLEGNLPAEIEELFFASGARLFPHGDNDVRSRCNCPDPVAPCKHVAALNYAFADALQRDPFLLFALRGKSRDQFLQDLRDMRGRDRAHAPAPAAEDLGRFWRMGRLAESVLKPVPWNNSSDPARLVQGLGEPDLEGIREGAFLSLMESTYRQVSEAMRRLPKDA